MTISDYVVVAAVSAGSGAVFGATIRAWFSKKVVAPATAEVAAVKTVVADVKKVI